MVKIFQGIAKFIDKNLCMASKEPAKKEVIKMEVYKAVRTLCKQV